MRKVSMFVAIGAAILFQGTCLARPSATITTAAVVGTIDSDYQDTFTGQSAGSTSDLITVVILCFSALGVSVFFFGVSMVNRGLRLYREITRENANGHATAEKQ